MGGYSTGMRARLALARAVLHEPDLLLLDEPTAGLDPESAKVVLGLIDEMAEDGKTVLMCTHLLLEAEGLADQVIVMDQGHTMVSGSPKELTRRYWPATRGVLLDADDPRILDTASELPYVQHYERNGVAVVDLDDDSQVPDLVDALVAAGARLTRVEARARRASKISTSRSGSSTVASDRNAYRVSRRRSQHPSLVIARTDLKQLVQARDFWMPLSVVALLFFVVIPAFLLFVVGSVKNNQLADKLSDVVGSLPKDLQANVHGSKGTAGTVHTARGVPVRPTSRSSCR